MAIRIDELVMRTWTNAGISLFRSKGDFYNLDSLQPDLFGRLKRSPAWSTPIQISTASEISIRGLFYDQANKRHVFICCDETMTSEALVTIYLDSNWSLSSTYDIVTAIYDLGGLSERNYAYWGGDLYVIGSNGHIYRGSDYTASLTDIYTGGDATVLAPFGDRMFAATSDGTILRLNDTDDGYDTYFAPTADIDVLYLAGYRRNLVIIARSDDGKLRIYQLADYNAAQLHEVTSISHASGEYPDNGSLFTLHDDKIYFSPGRVENVDGSYSIDVLAFDGTAITSIARLPDSASGYATLGLIGWRGELVFYGLNQGDNITHHFELLAGDRFTDLPSLTSDAISPFIPRTLCSGDLLFTTAKTDTQRSQVKFLGTHALSDGSVTTSHLDLGAPAQLKRLNRIAVLLNDAAANFNVVIKYLLDDDTSWTTAASCTNTRRAIASPNVDFYTLQLRIELDDNTGSNEDIRIDAISVLYTTGR